MLDRAAQEETLMAISRLLRAIYPKNVNIDTNTPDICVLEPGNDPPPLPTAFPVYPTRAAGHDLASVARSFLINFLIQHHPGDTILWRHPVILDREVDHATQNTIYLISCRTAVRPRETVEIRGDDAEMTEKPPLPTLDSTKPNP